MPVYAPIFLLKRLVKASRPQLRKMLEQAQPEASYTDGQQIGKSHTLIVRRGGTKIAAARSKQHVVVTLPEGTNLNDPEVVRKVRDASILALRLESKSYLPKRLQFIADQYGFQYSKVRFSHASSRWGSCSSNGTISLNIALMKLPFELIDYVLIHELAHTVHLNHSDEFWSVVSVGDPLYKQHRKLLKLESPTI